MTALEQQAVAALKAIVKEVAGPERPFSADSYLPAHLIHDARSVLEQADRQHVDESIEREMAKP